MRFGPRGLFPLGPHVYSLYIFIIIPSCVTFECMSWLTWGHLTLSGRYIHVHPPPPPTRRRGWSVHPATDRHLGFAPATRPVPHMPPTPYFYITVLEMTGDGPVSPKTWSKQRHSERSRWASVRWPVGQESLTEISRPSGSRSSASLASVRRLLTATTRSTKSQPSSSAACVIGRTVATTPWWLAPT